LNLDLKGGCARVGSNAVVGAAFKQARRLVAHRGGQNGQSLTHAPGRDAGRGSPTIGDARASRVEAAAAHYRYDAEVYAFLLDQLNAGRAAVSG
jgi:hypothetical protein